MALKYIVEIKLTFDEVHLASFSLSILAAYAT